MVELSAILAVSPVGLARSGSLTGDGEACLQECENMLLKYKAGCCASLKSWCDHQSSKTTALIVTPY
jgi:hypothetical protein